MDTTVFIGLSQQSALRRKLDVIAHNVANLNTTAFKKERVVFRQFLVEAEGAEATKGGKISYILDHGITRNLDQGTLVSTGNPLDIFLDGHGYLNVADERGDLYYTRNGRLSIDNEKFLTTLNGERVLDKDGEPIRFEEEDSEITISDNGVISSQSGAIASLGLYRFQNEQSLKRQGNSLYISDETPEAASTADLKVRQKAIEGSNVNSIETMVEMIDVLRAYQAVQKNQDKFQELRQDALRRLSQVR